MRARRQEIYKIDDYSGWCYVRYMKWVHTVCCNARMLPLLAMPLLGIVPGCARPSPEVRLPVVRFVPGHFDGPSYVTTIVLTASGGMFINGQSYTTPQAAAVAAKEDMARRTDALHLCADRDAQVSHVLALCSAFADTDIRVIGAEAITVNNARSVLSFSVVQPLGEEMYVIERTRNKITLTGREIGMRDLDRILARIASHRTDIPVCVVPDASLSYDKLIEILYLCNKAALINVHVLAKPPFEPVEIEDSQVASPPHGSDYREP